MTGRKKVLLAAGLIVSAATLALACDDDRKSGQSASDDGTFNSANGGSVKYQYEAGVTVLPVDGAAPKAPTCAEYCGAYETTCGFGLKNLDLTQPIDGGPVSGTSGYLDKATCLSMCAKMTVGEWNLGGDGYEAPLANTVLCRYATLTAPNTVDPEAGAEAGVADLTERCAVAGPVGVTGYSGTSTTYGSCGGACESYCSLAVASCVGVEGGTSKLWSVGDTYDACMSDCGHYITGSTFPNGLVSNRAGNSLNCRFFQVEQAATNTSACVDVGTNVSATSLCVDSY